MITAPEKYFENLWLIQSKNAPQTVLLLPSSENIYEIDLASRTIEAPPVLSLQKDHNAETIYFMVDRFHDNMDLYETICIVQYITPSGLKRIYPVPFYDVSTYKQFIDLGPKDDKPKLIFPWCIDGAATRDAGMVEYSIRFYKLDEYYKTITYNLSTLPAKGEVLHGMEVLAQNEDYDFTAEVIQQILSRIEAAKVYNSDIYWEERYYNAEDYVVAKEEE